MKKNMKGFTLIELLAVIVILAIIALIATPIIMNIINEAKKGANKDAAYGITKSIETAIALKMVQDTSFTPTCTAAAGETATPSNGSVTVCGVTATYKGTDPSSIKIILDDKFTITEGTTVTFGDNTYRMQPNGAFE